MSTELELLTNLSEIPGESRTSLADVVSESLDETVDEDEAARLWLEEIGRRDAERPVDDVMRNARAMMGWKTFRGREC
jgi:hypothetical protein